MLSNVDTSSWFHHRYRWEEEVTVLDLQLKHNIAHLPLVLVEVTPNVLDL